MVNIDYLYNPERAKPFFDKNYFLDKKLGFQVIENGTMLPHKDVMVNGKWTWGKGGIIDDKGEFIKSSHVHSCAGQSYTPPPESIKHSSETVIYLGLFYPVWGHCLTDNIRRIWFLKSEFFRTEFKNCPLIYIPWKNSPLEKQKNFSRLLGILDVNVADIRPITQPTKFEKIILPDGSFLALSNKEKVFTKEYRETIDMVRSFAIKNRTPTSNKKIYHFNGRKGVFESRLAEYFKSKGYEIVRPETLTFDEQLNQLINCEHFASIGCSAAHNSLFLSNNAEIIFIPRAASDFGYYQEIINQVRSLNINYVDSSLSVFSIGVGQSPHFYLISEQLKRFFGDKWDGFEEEDLKNFLQYVKDSVRKGLAFNENATEYYSPTFQDFMAQLKQREDLITACNMPPNWEKFQSQLTYQTHAHINGWRGWNKENEISGNVKQKRDIQAIKINFPNHKVYYSVYYNEKEDWSAEAFNGAQAGTTGKSKAIFGIKIRLDDTGAKEFDILYRVHKFDGKWTSWAKNGEAIYSHGQKLNALQIKLESKQNK